MPVLTSSKTTSVPCPWGIWSRALPLNQPLKEWECRRECLEPLEHSRIQQEEGANVRRREHRIPCCSRCTRCRLHPICDSLWPGSSPRGGGRNPGNCWQRRAVVSWRLSKGPWLHQRRAGSIGRRADIRSNGLSPPANRGLAAPSIGRRGTSWAPLPCLVLPGG